MVCVHLNFNILLSSPWCWWLRWGRWLFNVHAAKLLQSYMAIRFLLGFLQLWYKSSTANIFMNYMFPSNPGGATRLQDQKLHVRLEFRDRTCRPPWLLSARTLPRLAETSSWKWFSFNLFLSWISTMFSLPMKSTSDSVWSHHRFLFKQLLAFHGTIFLAQRGNEQYLHICQQCFPGKKPSLLPKHLPPHQAMISV